MLNCSSWIGREARDCGIQDYLSRCVCDACACARVFVWACTWDGWRIDSQKPVCWGWSDLFPELHKTFDQFSYSCFKKKKKSFLRNPIIQQRLSPETWIILILKVVPQSTALVTIPFFGGYLTWIRHCLVFWTLACLEQGLWKSWGGFTSEYVNRGLQSCLCWLVREGPFWGVLTLLICCKQPSKVIDDGNPREMVPETVQWNGSIRRQWHSLILGTFSTIYCFHSLFFSLCLCLVCVWIWAVWRSENNLQC